MSIEALRTLLQGAKGLSRMMDSSKVEVSRREVCPECGSREPLARLESGTCRGCEDLARSNREALDRRLSAIPERFRGYDFTNVPGWMVGDEGYSAALLSATSWLVDGGNLLTIGARREYNGHADNPTASGKTTLAGIVAVEAAKRGARVRWIDAADLDAGADHRKASEAYNAILSAEFAVIDGLGQEASKGRSDSFSAEARTAFSSKLPNKIHTSENQRFVVTLDITRERGEELYGSSGMRRLAGKECATRIALTRKTKLDVGGI